MSTTQNPPPELNDFVNIRGRPAMFLFLTESMNLGHVFQMREALGSRKFEEMDLVIHSGGGSIHAAYQIAELVRLHAKRVHACVPIYAKSAATLLCLGVEQIHVDDLAQLGPLDTQIYEEKSGGKSEFTSALNPFKTLEQLQRFSLETLDIAVKVTARRSGMNLDECLKHAIEFVRSTTGPLFTQLNPEKLGEYSRALAVGTEYGSRLLRRYNSSWDDNQNTDILEKLVHGYPSHEYIIDYHELKELGFNVSLFSDSERDSVRSLFGIISTGDTVIELIQPATESREQDTNNTEATS